MKEVIKKEILYDLTRTIEILEVKEEKDFAQLEKLSEHAIEDVALHKDLDLIAVTVLIYSLYKIVRSLSEEDHQDILTELQFAIKHLQQNNLSRYNKSIKTLYSLLH